MTHKEVGEILGFVKKGQTIHHTKLARLCESIEKFRFLNNTLTQHCLTLSDFLSRKTLTDFEKDTIQKILAEMKK